MKKLLYIDHSFKKYSRSTDFLLSKLNEKFIVDIIFDTTWKGIRNININELKKEKYDILILFQVLTLTPKELIKIAKKVIIVPMYDSSSNKPLSYWFPYKNFQFINFSLTLHKQLKKYGFDSFYIKFFPNPSKFRVNKDFTILKGFFWQRRSEITWNKIKELISNTDFYSFHLHLAVDPPGYHKVLPTEQEIHDLNIETTEWFADKNEFEKVSMKCNIFFAPRKMEGIGLSFLEAMAQGKCVVAPNYPTMNEYIRNGENGLLYELENPLPLDLKNAAEIGKNARNAIETGYLEFKNNMYALIDWIECSNCSKASIPVLLSISGYLSSKIYNFNLSVKRKIKKILKAMK